MTNIKNMINTTDNTTTTTTATTSPTTSEDKDKDTLLQIIYSHFPDTDPSQFYDNCQSGRLLGLAPEEANAVRNCYQCIRNNGLLPLFWQEFKAYRQLVKDRYKTNATTRKPKWCRDDVIHDSPNVWKWCGITAILDPSSRSIKIVDTTYAMYRHTFQLNYSWEPLPTTNPSMAELRRVKKTLQRKGVVMAINVAISKLAYC